MPKPIAVTIEHTPKKTFATAADWPGWSRSGKTEELALDALAAYAVRFAPIAEIAGGVPKIVERRRLRGRGAT